MSTSMPEVLCTETIPLATGADGVIRVGGTRVTLETVVAAFMDGATAEEIAQRYPSVSLADIYQTIGYYLRHGKELEPYLLSRQAAREETRRMNEARWPPDGIRERLLARRRS